MFVIVKENVNALLLPVIQLDVEFLEALVDFVDGKINLLVGMGGHQRYADERVFGRDGRGDHRADKDAFFEQHMGDREG